MTEPQHQQLEFNGGLTFTQKIGMVAGSVSALYLLPSGANAAIIHVTTPLSVSLTSGNSVFWDVDDNGINDFRLFNLIASASVIQLSSISVYGYGLVALANLDSNIVGKLNTSVNIGPSLATAYKWGSFSIARTVMSGNGGVGYPFGQGGFTAPGTGYFGFRFKNGTDIYYGWANIDIGQTTPGTVTIKEWAYNNIAGEPIHVAPIPEPTSSLALLAFGAAGVYRWRKGKGNQAQDDDHNEDKAA